ncbi:MAG: hypothetical protein ABIG03_00750 [Candidatus Eisenbacteria bacterium]
MKRGVPALVLIVAACVLAAGCGEPYDLESVRARADEMSTRILTAYYDSDAYGEESMMAEITADYDDLADPELARYVAERRDEARDPRSRKQLSYLYYDVVGTMVWKELAAIEDEILDVESGGSVTVAGEEIPYRDAGIRLYNETDSELRESLYLAMGEFDARNTNPLRMERVERTRERLRDYGFSDLDEFESQRRCIDHDDLEDSVVSFLEETRDIYWTLTNDASLDVFGVPVTEVKDYDRGRIFRGAEFDEHFPADGALPLLEKTLLGMGIDLDELPMIHIDSEDRPEKEPRPASYGIVPGRDVRILLKPAGGVGDYQSLFHEIGHALHDAFVEVDEYEFRRLGDYGTTETHAYVPESLLSNPAFLEENGLLPDPAARKLFRRKQLLGDLGSARYYAGLFRYERLLHRGELTDAELVDAYGEFMEESRLVPLERPEFGYLSSDEEFYGVNYLEAWFLAAQVRAALVERFGETWWNSVEAGELLKELWSYGAELCPDEIARILGYDGLDSSYFIEELRSTYADVM